MRLLTVVILAFVLAGCANERESITGVVENVRITSSVTQQASGDDAVGGAIVGGLIAGTVGAVVGAAAGSSGGKVTVVQNVEACAFVATVDGKKITFTAIDKRKALSCSLLREGDRINIIKVSEGGQAKNYTWVSKRGLVFGEVAN